jgi:hypothetical protein
LDLGLTARIDLAALGANNFLVVVRHVLQKGGERGSTFLTLNVNFCVGLGHGTSVYLGNSRRRWGIFPRTEILKAEPITSVVDTMPNGRMPIKWSESFVAAARIS